MDGTRIPTAQLDSSRMVKSLRQLIQLNSKSKVEEYRKRWNICFDGAIEATRTQYYSAKGFDLRHRYFHPKDNTEFRLCLIPGKLLHGGEVTKERLLAAIEAVNDKGYKKSVQPIIYLEDEQTAAKNKLVKISTNPLGLYSTWIEQETNNELGKLVKAQVNDNTWIRPQPTWDQAEEFDKAQDEKVRHWRSTEPQYIAKLVQFPGEKLINSRRIKTEVIMGDSANQWAIKKLKWNSRDEAVCAEWLHIIAHRFWPAATDNFQNMIFGTKECNTQMMRAEAAITQLLLSGKVYAVGVTGMAKYHLNEVDVLDDDPKGGTPLGPRSITIGWHESKGRMMKPHPHWLTARLDYEITTFMPNEDKSARLHKTYTVFHPFSQQLPFRYEYELDKVLLSKYLEELPTPTEFEMIEMGKEIRKKLSEKREEN
ncbi:betaine lipid synthase [Ceratobasidium sp. AG-Ba]|nr:betaine lipid synthase [Ceratobasidium sp. AG-Ba]QRW13801.1 betaine lipid synthase [Ceratobasidium sp. AG-Ba]